MLWEYFPASRPNLDADLATSLAMVPDGRKEDRGVAIGAAAADRMIASRVGDGRNDTSIVLLQAGCAGHLAAAGDRHGPGLARLHEAGRRRPAPSSSTAPTR